MSISKFAEKILGVRLYKYQKDLIDRMEVMCNNCPAETRSVCKAYGGFCDKWRRLDNRNNLVSYLLCKPEIRGDN